MSDILKNEYYKHFSVFLNNKMNLETYDINLEKEFNTILISNLNQLSLSKYFKLYNNISLDRLSNDEYKYFENLIANVNSDDSIEKFIEKTYAEVIKFNDDNSKMYYVKLNDNDINPNNIVKNNCLVLVIDCINDFNVEARQRVVLLDEFNNFLKILEKQFEDVLHIPVRILTNVIVVPPKNIVYRAD